MKTANVIILGLSLVLTLLQLGAAQAVPLPNGNIKNAATCAQSAPRCWQDIWGRIKVFDMRNKTDCGEVFPEGIPACKPGFIAKAGCSNPKANLCFKGKDYASRQCFDGATGEFCGICSPSFELLQECSRMMGKTEIEPVRRSSLLPPPSVGGYGRTWEEARNICEKQLNSRANSDAMIECCNARALGKDSPDHDKMAWQCRENMANPTKKK